MRTYGTVIVFYEMQQIKGEESPDLFYTAQNSGKEFFCDAKEKKMILTRCG